jgi:hypothetical protein
MKVKLGANKVYALALLANITPAKKLLGPNTPANFALPSQTRKLGFTTWPAAAIK